MKRLDEIDFETAANMLARAAGETGNLADALRTVAPFLRGEHACDTGAAGLNDLVVAVAETMRLRPSAVLGSRKAKDLALARDRVWYIGARRGLREKALAAAFSREQPAVSKGIARERRRLEESAEERALVEWLAARRDGVRRSA